MDLFRHHKPPRLPGWDCSTPGYCSVTFNTRVRGRNVLSRITNAGDAALGVPLVALTSAGLIVRELIENIPRVYSDVRTDSYVIMPDHVHLLLLLGRQDGPPKAAVPTSVPKVINTLKRRPPSVTALPCGRMNTSTTSSAMTPIWPRPGNTFRAIPSIGF